ncbi:LOW QUALITY PROTEIN: CLAVATA3/ESR (CLE)-related protein TDIF [Mangifera indica]|uniref:LOW QUALITY PROTEIN: CLAVATA3/ESR (CLE)-related protein TDIF n=1 Tax=Mangifera indica TaxID=29780 RepID=UPI001CFA2E87|nr:LOW QUALITY PROTEIN: CLAVATA3/ESR (CLE)-related protein TDIF [Mangifera indica]
MDIEPLRALGGWFISLDNCMAAPKTPSNFSVTTSKSHFLYLLFALFCIFLILLSSSYHENLSKMSPSITHQNNRFLLESSESSSSSTTATMNLHPEQTKNKAAKREYEAAAHEVPSGPNPISNR